MTLRPFATLPLPLPLTALAFALSTTGCGSVPALVVKASDPSTYAEPQPDQPLIVEFDEGDVVPLTLLIEGELFETKPPPPPITIVAKRHFFVKIDKSGVKSSVDGEHWNASRKKGSFAFGLGFTKEGTQANARIVTPSYGP
jgi:hypothetical protein